MSDQPHHEVPEQDAVVQGRRRLLKAAAASAPLIATLPNGAAFATASTAQCVIEARDASKTDQDSTFDAKAALGDGYVRVKGIQTEFTRVVESKTRQAGVTQDVDVIKVVYSFPSAPSTYYNVDGTVFNPAEGGWTKGASQEVYLLRVFVPTDGSGTPVGTDPQSVDNCSFVSGVAQDIPPQCIYPVGQRDFYRDDGNMGLTTSCLCSVNPTLVPGACDVAPG